VVGLSLFGVLLLWSLFAKLDIVARRERDVGASSSR
jgi:hypothetical protein